MQCITPFSVKQKLNNETIAVPCGKCPPCLSRRASHWSFRLTQHLKDVNSAYFVTLTYDVTNVPMTEKNYMNLSKRDLQLFFKRLRKYNKSKIQYYAVGEYGTTTFRPHYHIIIYNVNEQTLQKAWQLGFVHIGKVTPASIGYTLKYISKLKKIPIHQNDDRQKEFSLMSKRLGANYLTDAMIKWHKNDLDIRMYCNIQDGKKISMPRYYKDKIYNETERKTISFFARQKMLEQTEENLKDPDFYYKKLQSDKQLIKNFNYKNRPKNHEI